MKRIIVWLATVAAFLGSVLGAPTAAGAATTTHKWVANFTDQCTNPSICGKEFLGGEWGHAVFVRDDATGMTTGEVEVSFAFHDVQGAGPLASGVSHLKTHVSSWSVGPGFAPASVPNVVFDRYTSTFTGGTGLFTDGIHGGPPFESSPCFLGCPLFTEIPAVAGHYTLGSFFGFDEEPGYSYVATVVQLS